MRAKKGLKMRKIILKNQDKTKDIENYGFKNELLWVKFFNNDKKYSYSKGNYEILDNELSKNELDTFEYFKEVAKIAGLKTDDKQSLLANEYEKLGDIKAQSVLFSYLNANAKIATYENKMPLIFPFGSNLSQFKAVNNALTSQVSIIEGPPGTGKTQTILNIIANLLCHNKNIAIVSNNNAATQNVLEKLEKCDLDYLCAMLGNRENKEKFIANQEEKILKFKQIHKTDTRLKDLKYIEREIDECNQNLQTFFKLQNDIAENKALLAEFELEFTHFKGEIKDFILPKLRNLAKLKPEKILYLKNQMQESGKIGFLLKLKLVLCYGIGDFAFYKNQMRAILQAFEYLFYESKINFMQQRLKQDCTLFEKLKEKDILNKLQSLSMQFLKNHLSKKYAKFECVKFDSIYTKTSELIKQYPIIFSTTHSIVSALKPQFCFDYLICDEASQVDLASGTLALSMAKNIVIVGDTKQLPNILPKDKKPIQALNERYSVAKYHNYLKHSFLSSIIEKFTKAPKLLLQEHYRCHPDIIGFCNQKFYDDKLIILSKGDEKDGLKLTFTALGNHARGRFNQREIDEIMQVILPELRKSFKDTQIGIITPYNEQKTALKKAINSADIQIDTVHKFQGREKEAIIISVVCNEANDFVNQLELLNVAITRAKRLLRVVVSPEFMNKNSHIKDLIKYAKYHQCQINQSSIKSIFDLLYKQNYEARRQYLNKRRISQYDSENIAFNEISKILRQEFTNCRLACFVPLSRMIKDESILSEDELRYALNPRTHIDFVIFHKMDKTPLLAIEIDGYAFHNPKTAQARRDELKNAILEKNNFKFLRLKTNESSEEKRLKEALSEALNGE